MAQRGRRSAADLETRPIGGTVERLAPAPDALEPDAKALWRRIVEERRHDYFSAADEPLLREYCHTVATLLPKVQKLSEEEFDTQVLDARDKLVRQAAALARSLRLCVSSRTRPDTAAMRDSVSPRPRPPWEA